MEHNFVANQYFDARYFMTCFHPITARQLEPGNEDTLAVKDISRSQEAGSITQSMQSEVGGICTG